MKYLAHKNSDEIKYIDLIKIIENALPEDKELSINVIILLLLVSLITIIQYCEFSTGNTVVMA